jgi:hypothetical protein
VAFVGDGVGHRESLADEKERGTPLGACLAGVDRPLGEGVTRGW